MFFVQTNANTHAKKGGSAMGDAYTVFTISNGEVVGGTEIGIFEKSFAIVIGKDDDNSFSVPASFSGAVPVEGISNEQSQLLFAEIKKTWKGEVKFLARHEATTDGKVIVVIRAKKGYKQFNWVTGACIGWQCRKCSATGTLPCAPKICPRCKAGDPWSSPVLRFANFPGEILARGRVVSANGWVGAGEQIIALVQKGGLFRIGCLYSTSSVDSAHYVCDGIHIAVVPQIQSG